MANYNKLTEKQFEMAKAIFKGGANATKVAEYIGIGEPTACRIRRFETFNDYVTDYEMRRTGKKAVEPEQKHATVVVPWEVRQEMQKTNELLKQISAKLAFIVEELTGVKTDAKQDH